MKTEEQTDLTDQETIEESSPLKPFLLGLGSVVIVIAILVLLPMLFTYLSEGNIRAPSQIHPTDPLGKSDKTVYESLKPKK